MTATLKTNTVLVGISTVLLTVLCAFAAFAYDAVSGDIQDRKDEITILRSDIKELTEAVNQSVWTDSTLIWRLNDHVRNGVIHVGD